MGRPRVRAALVLAVALALAGCNGKGQRADAAPPKPVSDIYFVDSTSAAIPVEKSPSGLRPTNSALVGQLLLNTRSEPVRVTRVEPVVETGLRATYLGHSTCHRGCPGAIGGEDEAIYVDRLDGQYPIQLPPNKKDQTLVFRLEADGAQGAEHLVRHCHLHVRYVILTLDDGQRVEVRFGGGSTKNDWAMRVHLGGPAYPEGTSPECRDAQTIRDGS